MFKEKDRKQLVRIGVVIIIQILLFLAATMITTPYYETDDDNTMAAIALGLYGKRDYHLVFIHTLIGKIVILLTNILPIVNYYTVLQWAVLFCAFTAILLILTKKTNLLQSIVVIALIGVGFGFQFYHSVQFTKTAGTATLAGVLILVDAIENHQMKKFPLFLGAGFLLMGSMYRFESYGMVLCMCFLWVLFLLLCQIKKKKWHQVKQYFIWFGSVILLSVALYAGDIALYRADLVWKDYRVYNELRSNLLDLGFPKMEENEELYKALEITEVDYLNYSLWDFADTEKFKTETMQQLVDAKKPERYVANIKTFFTETIFVVLEYPFFWLIPIGILYFLFLKKRELFAVGMIAAGIVV